MTLETTAGVHFSAVNRALFSEVMYEGLFQMLMRLLDFAQVESGKLVLEKAEFNLEAELTALIDVFSVQCDNKNLLISLDLAG